MTYKIHSAVVIGAGTMGAAIAAHLANTGVPVTLLDNVPDKLNSEEEAARLTLKDKAVRNRITSEGWNRCIKAQPAALMASDLAALVKSGNLEDDFDAIGQVDWVIESTTEALKIKQDLMARIDAIRRPETIISTCTTAIPIGEIADGRSKGFKQHFLGTHFFDPPRYSKLLEINPTSDTLPGVTRFMGWFGEFRLGKRIVLGEQTPGSIAGRTAADVKGAFDLNDIPQLPGLIVLGDLKKARKVINENPGASLYDMGDGVALVEFHTGKNVLDDDIFTITDEALTRAENEFMGVVIGNDSENFSAGENIGLILESARSQQWAELEQMVKRFQRLNMRMRFFPRPVVIALAGKTLGGGCEIAMHGSRMVAAAETYFGLVELGAGLIPAGGGTKELMRRILNPIMRVPGADFSPYLQRIFELIGQAKVTTSAEEARQMGFMTRADRVVFNREHLLTEAKREVLHMASTGFYPPVPELIFAGGREALASLRIGIWSLKEARYITGYDSVIAEKLANIIAGGDLSRPTWVSEQYILDLECEAFLSLCGEEKTRARLFNMLQTGKPLRN